MDVTVHFAGVDAHPLRDVSGVLRPGRVTLLTGGDECSLLLRVLSGQYPAHGGAVRYNGLTQAEALSSCGVRISKLITLAESCEQSGSGAGAQLTVRETLEFAAACVTANAALRAREVSEMLELESCMDTVVGSDTLRGISGGQRQRLVLGEALASLPFGRRVLLLEKPTTGLDAPLALRIMKRIQSWAVSTNSTVAAVLLQPSPDILALCEDAICIANGRVAYRGPTSGMGSYFASLGFRRPLGADVADWVTDVLISPKGAVDRVASHPELFLPTAAASAASKPPVAPPLSAQALSAACESRCTRPLAYPVHDAAVAVFRGAPPALLAMWSQARERSFAVHFWLLLSRQAKIVYRNVPLLLAHTIGAVVMGLLLGSLFRSPSQVQGDEFAAVIMFAAFVLSFASMPEVAVAFEAKQLVVRQTTSGLYSPAAYVFAVLCASLPLLLVEVFVLISPLYVLVGFNADTGRYFFVILAYFLLDACLVSYFRFVALCAPSAIAAEAIAAPSTGILILFAGFLVTSRHIPRWLLGLFYLSPYSWIVRSIMLNEMLAPTGQFAQEIIAVSSNAVITYGDEWLAVFEIDPTPGYLWGGIGYLGCLALLLQVGCLGALLYHTYHRSPPAMSAKPAPLKAAAGTSAAAAADGAVSTCPAAAATVSSVQSSAKWEGASDAALSAYPAPDSVLLNLAPGSVVTRAPPLIPGAPLPAALVIQRVGYSVPRRRTLWLWLSDGWRPRGTASATSGSRTSTAATATVARREDGAIAADAATATAVAATAATPLQLLDDVSAELKPGTLCALLGGSGAGKTTLLDVIAGVKTMGHVSGSVLIDGVPQLQIRASVSPSTAAAAAAAAAAVHNRHTISVGYVEQSTAMIPTDTVREAIDFSARLRLPRGTSVDARTTLVDHILRLIGLEECADVRIGSSDGDGSSSSGDVLSDEPVSRVDWLQHGPAILSMALAAARTCLSSAQRRLVAIGIELAARPSLILLDEPTSGLDSTSAAAVMALLRRLAMNSEGGVTVLVSIHQPSLELLSYFDSAVVLCPGGKQAFAGDIGPLGRRMAAIFERNAAPEGSRVVCPADANPATWVLQQLSGEREEENNDRGSSSSGVKNSSTIDAVNSSSHEIGAVVPAPPAASSSSCRDSSSSGRGRGALWYSAAWAASSELRDIHASFSNSVDLDSKTTAVFKRNTHRPPATVFTQIRVLSVRAWRASYRDTVVVVARLAAVVILAVLTGALYYQLDSSLAGGVQSILAMWFVSLAMVAMLYFATNVAAIVKQRAVIFRESSGTRPMYRSDVLMVVLELVEVPHILTLSLVYAAM